MDLIKGCSDDNKPKNRVEVVLRWAASESGFWLEEVNEVANDDLDDVEDEKYEPKSLIHGLDTTGKGVVKARDIQCVSCRSDYHQGW